MSRSKRYGPTKVQKKLLSLSSLTSVVKIKIFPSLYIIISLTKTTSFLSAFIREKTSAARARLDLRKKKTKEARERREKESGVKRKAVVMKKSNGSSFQNLQGENFFLLFHLEKKPG